MEKHCDYLAQSKCSRTRCTKWHWSFNFCPADAVVFSYHQKWITSHSRRQNSQLFNFLFFSFHSILPETLFCFRVFCFCWFTTFVESCLPIRAVIYLLSFALLVWLFEIKCNVKRMYKLTPFLLVLYLFLVTMMMMMIMVKVCETWSHSFSHIFLRLFSPFFHSIHLSVYLAMNSTAPKKVASHQIAAIACDRRSW